MANINGVAGDIVLKKDLVNYIYPIGSYYWTEKPVDPSELFGGDWERIQGKFILAAGTYTDKNGEERSFEVGETDNGEYRHTLIESEMPTHWHKTLINWNNNPYRIKSYQTNATNGGAWTLLSPDTSTNINEYENGAVYAATVGGDQPHNNMPPYEVAYCWKRIA